MHPVLLDSSFLIALEREIEAGLAGPAMAWLRHEKGRRERALLVTPVSIGEFLEGFDDKGPGLEFIARFRSQTIGYQHATKCAEVQRAAAKRGARFGENDAWQIASAELAKASIVGRDSKAFTHLGKRYEELH